MTTRVLQFVALPDRDRTRVGKLPRVGRGKRVEVRVRGGAKSTDTVPLPPRAAALVDALLGHLARGEKVAILAEDQEVTPSEAAVILGMSRPLVVHRMEVGDLPFRFVGKHRRAKLRDVLALKEKLDRQQATLDALAEDTEGLIRDHGL